MTAAFLISRKIRTLKNQTDLLFLSTETPRNGWLEGAPGPPAARRLGLPDPVLKH